MIVTLPTRADRAPITNPANPTPRPCGMNGLACTSNCGNCPSARPVGMGAFYDGFPAPFNNPLVLAGIALVVLLVFGGGISLFGGGRRSSNRRRAKLSVIKHQAELDRAKLLAS